MSYIEDICEPLITTLERASNLPAHQLAGYVANLDFWLSEAKHCLQIVDGYEQRFERMKDAQEFQAKIEGVEEPLLQRGVGSKKIKIIRQQIELTVSKFLQRCFEEQLIDEETWQVHQEEMA